MKIYHYCSLPTLFSIIQRGKIWFSDLKDSNDYLEDELIFDMFGLYLEKNCSTEFQKKVTELNQKELLRAKNKTSIYGICLTTDDDGILQWMTYGRENSVCLEFDRDELSKYFSQIHIFVGEEPPKVKEVHYVSKNSEEYNEEFRLMLKANENYICNCYKELVDLSIYTKLKSWELEHEYRVAFRNFVDKDNNVELPRVKFGDGVCKFDYIVKNNKPVFHYEIPFDIKLIKKITIGPNSSITDVELKNKLSLMNDKIDFEDLDIVTTKLTYRK